MESNHDLFEYRYNRKEISKKYQIFDLNISRHLSLLCGIEEIVNAVYYKFYISIERISVAYTKLCIPDCKRGDLDFSGFLLSSFSWINTCFDPIIESEWIWWA
jgi:hypothetical protein